MQSLGIIPAVQARCCDRHRWICGWPVLLAAALSRCRPSFKSKMPFRESPTGSWGRFMSGIALGYPEAGRYFPKDGRVIVTGNPIRREIAAISRKKAW